MNVGELREALKDVPDDYKIFLYGDGRIWQPSYIDIGVKPDKSIELG